MAKRRSGIPSLRTRAACLGVAPRVCKARKPQTKGKVERSVGVIKDGFWPGVRFTDSDDLNQQARAWCDRLNQKVHRSTKSHPDEQVGRATVASSADGLCLGALRC